MKRVLGRLDKVFAKRLRALRGNESQLAFAKKLQIAQSTLNRIENLEQSVTLSLVEKISCKLKVPVSDLVG